MKTNRGTRRPFWSRSQTIAGALCVLLSLPDLPSSLAQTQAPSSSQQSQQSGPIPSPRPETRSTQKSEEERKVERKEQSQRALGVLPQFGVTSRQDAPPLTPGEKF